MYKPEVVAPGYRILSNYKKNRRSKISGTSQAAPHVAGAIALLKQVNPEHTGTQIKYILMNTAHDLGTSGEDNNYGHGIIDLWAAYQAMPRPVRFTNEYNSGNASGSLLLDFVQVIPSGSYRHLPINSNHNIKTNNERFRITTTTAAKHHHLNDIFTEYKLSHNFPVLALVNNDQVAHFRDLKPVSIRNELLDAPAIPTGSVDFRDPWYMNSSGLQPNSFETFSSPFYPTGAQDSISQGVFLDQRVLQDRPFYSLRIQDPQPMFGTVGYFLGWDYNTEYAELIDESAPSGYLQKSVVFKQEGAEITAKYKGHLISSTSAATASNAQHKMVRLEDGRLLTVYESGDLIFSSISEDGGQTWNPEFMFAEESGNLGSAKFRSPSLCVVDNTAYLSYEFVDDGYRGIDILKFNGEHWDFFYEVDFSDVSDESFHATPVIAGGKFGPDQSVLLCVWKHPEELKISGFSFEGYTSSKNSIITVTIPTTTVHSTSPA